MTILSVFNGKGGSGKSTVAEVLGVELGASWIDTDPQGSLSVWGSRRDTAVVHSADGPDAATLASTLSGLVVIDTPGVLTTASLDVLQVADLILIPTSNRQNDLDALTQTVDVVRDLGARAVFILTRVHPRLKVESMAELLAPLQVPLCPYRLAERVAYDHAASLGMTASELEPDGPAAEESRLVAQWVMGHV